MGRKRGKEARGKKFVNKYKKKSRFKEVTRSIRENMSTKW